MRFTVALFWIAACFVSASQLSAAHPTPTIEEDFIDDDKSRWESSDHEGDWVAKDGALCRTTGASDTLCVAKQHSAKDVVVDTQLRLEGKGRQVFGLAMRAKDNTYLLIRYYDGPRALEVLSYQRGAWSRLGGRSRAIQLRTSTWYRLKAAVIGDTLMGKIWPADEVEPNWQLDVEVDNLSAGQVGLVAHDNTQVQFDWIRVWSGNNAVEIGGEAVKAIDSRRRQKKSELLTKLQLAVVPTHGAVEQNGTAVRKVNLVTLAETDRHPIAGRLTVTYENELSSRDVAKSDFIDGAYVFEIPEPRARLPVSVAYRTDQKELQAEFVLEPAQHWSWRDYVRSCLDTLIEHGRDEYGEIHSPLFMAVLDADTLRSPRHPMQLDALVRLEGRLHRRSERGTNLWYDQRLIKSLYRMSKLTGEQKYAKAADEYVGYFFNHCYKDVDPKHTYLNGMPAWGTHVYWDCYRDRPAGDGDGNGPHEVLVFRAEWESMFRVHPQGVRKTIDGIWNYHVVDKISGLHNRHDDQTQGCDFAFSGSSFAHALSFLYSQTNQKKYLEQAKTVVDWHWNNRNSETGLTADCPGLTRRYDGNHCFTTVSGPHAMALLECYRLTGDRHFRDVAIGYVKAYDHYGWDEENQTYWAMLKLDGTPIPDRPKGSGYDAFAPYGHVNMWRPTIYSYEFTLAAAQVAIAAYEVTVRDGNPDVDLLQIARRWGSVVERAMPPHTSRRWKSELEEAMPRAAETGGAYAEDYGRAISLFVHLHRATKEEKYLELAKELAKEAVSKLYHNGLFLGHPAKPYYENTNGVGLLLVALLELDAPSEILGGAL
ncbi:MAG: hypothetical protein ACR2NM_00575 [Bythopirellula sp.]